MDFIYINENSLPKKLCEDLINAFENSKQYQYKGVIYSGLNTDVKDTTDLKLPFFVNQLRDAENLYDLNTELYKILSEELKIYIDKFLKECISIRHAKLYDTGFQMQKYNKGIGKFTYHDDFNISKEDNSKRILTYIWYINTVEEGGETVFGDNIWIKPEAGKLIIFPCCWTYPHKGCIPLSNDKYIITGWFHSNDKDFLGNT